MIAAKMSRVHTGIRRTKCRSLAGLKFGIEEDMLYIVVVTAETPYAVIKETADQDCENEEEWRIFVDPELERLVELGLC